MVKVPTLASAVSIVAGGWDVYAVLSVCHSACLPGSFSAPYQGFQGVLFAALSVILVLEGLAGFVGPRTVFYAGVFVALPIDAMELLNYSSIIEADLYVTLLLVTLSLVLSLWAARSGTSVSEESHPMNLPVFG